MSATDELRKMLDERGVEWSTNETLTDCWTRWNVGNLRCTATEINGRFAFTVGNTTPEQAIAVTLGSGTCHMSLIDEYETASGEEEYLCECSECGYRRWEPAHDLPLYCSKCGRRVVEL